MAAGVTHPVEDHVQTNRAILGTCGRLSIHLDRCTCSCLPPTGQKDPKGHTLSTVFHQHHAISTGDEALTLPSKILR